LGEHDPKAVMVSYSVPEDGSRFARAVDLLTPMRWSEVVQWKDLPSGRRGQAYEELKQRWAEKCIDRASKHVPGLRGSIAAVYSSTPLTYASWLNMPEGAAYGIRKDWNRPMQTLLTPRTPLSNLLLTGQNLNLHGILGVSVTALFTCAGILGWNTVRQLLKG
jgi:all-trans-retinol 13,14-reductase